MKTNKSTKRALLLSVCAIMLCAVMLIGTTFAWFTDTASTAVNTIQSGTLDIVLEYATEWNEDGSVKTWTDAEGKTLSFIKSAKAPEGEELLWEPGVTYDLPELRIRNNGKLALKYKVTVNGATGDTKLLEAIDFTVKKNGANVGEKLEGWEGHLLPAGAPATDSESNAIQFAISGHMKEAAGNEYQRLTLNGIGLTVVATQYTYEYDSNDNQYDAGAEIPAVAGNTDDLNTLITGATTDGKATIALPSNAEVTLDNGIAHEGDKSRDVTIIGDGSQTVDVVDNAITAEGGQLNYQRGSTFTFENLTIQAGEGSFDGIVCDELIYKNCTIKGKLTLYGKATFIDCKFENTMANQYSIWTWGGTDVTFENCVFNTNGKAILLYGKATDEKPTNLTVTNCTFNDRNNGTAGKAAIEIGNDYNATYTLTVNNVTVNGFADGKNTGSKVWANKNSMDAAHLTVTIDGTKVQ